MSRWSRDHPRPLDPHRLRPGRADVEQLAARVSIRRLPWWFCTGWWSPWCLLDAVARCKVPWLCKRHDDAQVRWFEARFGKADSDYDWTEDDSLDSDTLHALVDGLPTVDVVGKPRVIVTSTWPLYANLSTGTAATVTWREDGSTDWRWS